MHPELERILVAINTAVEGMSNAELAQHPPGKWSTAEILEHLSLTYSGTTRSLSKSLAAGLTNGGPDMSAPSTGSLMTLIEARTLSTPKDPSERPYRNRRGRDDLHGGE